MSVWVTESWAKINHENRAKVVCKLTALREYGNHGLIWDFTSGGFSYYGFFISGCFCLHIWQRITKEKNYRKREGDVVEGGIVAAVFSGRGWEVRKGLGPGNCISSTLCWVCHWLKNSHWDPTMDHSDRERMGNACWGWSNRVSHNTLCVRFSLEPWRVW